MSAPRRALLALAGIAGLACSAGDGAETGPDLLRLLPAEATASIGPETRLALILQPPNVAERRLPVVLPEGALLQFGYGIPNKSLVEGHAGARFEVRIVPEGGEEQQIFEDRVEPRDRQQRRWFDVEADLSAWSGPATLVFAMEPARGEPPLGAFSDPVVSTRRRGEPGPRANVIVISLDTLRARSLSSYGYPRETSPFFDALAREGALFEDAITTSVTTAPSHMSMFTGLYPVNHGLHTGLGYKPERVVTLAEALRAQGYHTAAFTENGYLLRERGFGSGFSEYTENTAEKRRGPGEVRLTFGQAQRFLAAPPREPFHLFVHTYEVHSPFFPPLEYGPFFLEDGHPGPEDPAIRRERDNYDREIRFLDDKLRELVAALDARGLRERSLLVITADHGEEFHEHGYYQHGGTLFDETLHIPLLLLGPGIPSGRHTGQVSLIDLVPTVLDYLDLAAPPELDGRSLLPGVRGEAPLPERTLFAEARGMMRWRRPFLGDTWSPPLYAVRTDGEKYLVHRPEEGPAEPTLHFDLRADALEQRPRRVEGDELARVDALLDAYLESRLAPDEVRKADSPDEIDPALREQLEQLGYLEPDAAEPSEP